MIANNNKSRGKVAVLYGGNSAEREISLKSGMAIYEALKRKNFDVISIDIGDDIARNIMDSQFDVAFIALHGRGGEDGTIQGFLECLNIPYTGSGVMASAIAMDKWRTKLIWSAESIPTPVACILDESTDWEHVIERLNFNAIVKPAREGSSIGMRRVKTAKELQDSFLFAKEYDGLVLAEQWVEGREYTVAVIAGDAYPVIQLKTNHEFYDFEAKYKSNDTQYLLPSGLPSDLENAIKELAEKAYQLIGCRGWARVDVMQDKAGQFWLLEVNTSPGMTDHSLVPMAAKALGLSFDDLVEKILLDVFDDYEKK